MRILPACCPALALLCLAAAPARASLTLLPTLASYNANSIGNTTVDFAGIVAPGGFQLYNPPTLTRGGVDFSINQATSNGSLYLIGAGYGGPPAAFSYGNGPVLSSQLSTSGVNNLVITLPGAYTSFAVDFKSIHYNDQTADPLTFTLSTGDSFQVTPTYGTTYEFRGVLSSVAFTSITITDSARDGFGVISLADLRFGTASPVAAAVPEPSTLALWAIAGIGTALGVRRRARASA